MAMNVMKYAAPDSTKTATSIAAGSATKKAVRAFRSRRFSSDHWSLSVRIRPLNGLTSGSPLRDSNCDAVVLDDCRFQGHFVQLIGAFESAFALSHRPTRNQSRWAQTTIPMPPMATAIERRNNRGCARNVYLCTSTYRTHDSDSRPHTCKAAPLFHDGVLQVACRPLKNHSRQPHQVQ